MPSDKTLRDDVSLRNLKALEAAAQSDYVGITKSIDRLKKELAVARANWNKAIADRARYECERELLKARSQEGGDGK